jgi:DedD protein
MPPASASPSERSQRPPLSAAELELKRRGRRRLIGALTIGILAVVLLPMIFDNEPKRKDTVRQEIEVQLPPKDGMPPLAAPVAVPSAQADTAPAKVGAAAASNTPLVGADAKIAVAPVTPSSSALPMKPESKPAIKPETKPETKPDPASKALPVKAEPKSETKTATKAEPKQEPKAVDAPASGGFVIQIGAFKDADNAKAVVARMKEAKLPVFTDTVPVKTGSVTRVRVGPFTSKEKAESALAQVKLAGVDGKVVPTP